MLFQESSSNGASVVDAKDTGTAGAADGTGRLAAAAKRIQSLSSELLTPVLGPGMPSADPPALDASAWTADGGGGAALPPPGSGFGRERLAAFKLARRGRGAKADAAPGGAGKEPQQHAPTVDAPEAAVEGERGAVEVAVAAPASVLAPATAAVESAAAAAAAMLSGAFRALSMGAVPAAPVAASSAGVPAPPVAAPLPLPLPPPLADPRDMRRAVLRGLTAGAARPHDASSPVRREDLHPTRAAPALVEACAVVCVGVCRAGPAAGAVRCLLRSGASDREIAACVRDAAGIDADAAAMECALSRRRVPAAMAAVLVRLHARDRVRG